MKLRERIESLLCNQYGLWPDEASETVRRMIAPVKTGEIGPQQRNALQDVKWNDDESAYPKQMLVILLMTAKAEAVELLETEKPMHFALSLLKAEEPSK